jgi:quercetin dioxygenase-like cupin family protein
MSAAPQGNGGSGWGGPQRDTTYSDWCKAEGVPIYKGSHVPDLHVAEVGDWPRTGQKGAIINLAAQEQNDGWLLEIAPGGQTEVMHHLFEATYYVVEGRGATTIWQPGSNRKQTVEWSDSALFSPPLNSMYQHFNLDGQKPARIFAATTAPMQINLVRNADFVFNTDYVFRDRYNEQDDYFTNPGQKIATRRWQTNFIPNTKGFKLEEWKERGAGGTNMFFVMSGNAMSAHMSEFPPGTYKKGHRHGPGAELIILSGIGYSLLWFKGDKKKEMVPWKEGSIFSPMDGQYHQHFNSGPEPARYLAYTFGALYIGNTMANRAGADVSEKEGGWQIEYEDEDPDVLETFQAECAKNGAEVKLDHPRLRTASR